MVPPIAVARRSGLSQRQSDASALDFACAGVQSIEGDEYPVDQFRPDPLSGVGDLHPEPPDDTWLTVTTMLRPGLLNFTAFDTRLMRTCFRQS